MLRLYLGENQGEKLRVCAEEMKRFLSVGKRVLAIVPDQFSFAYDKALYRELGPKAFNSVTVLSFKRLSEALIGKFGAPDGTLVTPNDRMIILWLALKNVRAEKSLRILSRSVEKPAFCDDMSELFDSFGRGGVTVEALKKASDALSGTLGDKLSDVAEIYSEYISLMHKRSLRDESSEISEGAKIAAENSVFRGTDIYVDRFDSFTQDELMLLSAMTRDADSVTVCIPAPKSFPRSAVSPFAHCAATQKALVALAEQTNTRVEFLSCDLPKTADRVLAGLGECLFGRPKEKFQSCESVFSVRADTVHEESEYVAAKIRELVTKEGYGFNDIAVITHDIEGYSGPLSAAFSRYGIEAFIDRPEPASGMSLVLFALDAVEAAATRAPDTDKILRYIRSPFSPLDTEEVSLLWDYTVRWNVDKEMWKSDFTARTSEDLAAVNSARKKAVEPLLRLHEAAKSATAKQTASAFCEFLKETDAAKRAYDVIEDCADPDLKLVTARLFKQLWNAVMSAVSSIYLIAGDEKMSLRAFGDLLRLILSRSSVSNPPQKLESVTVADVGRSVIAAPRVAFVVGLADGVFPADVKKTGLFSGRDIAALNSLGLRFDITPEARLCSERFDCHKALTAPTERLYLSFSGADLKGRELRPSRFLASIRDYCGVKTVSANSFGPRLYCSTPAAAYYNSAVSESMTPTEKSSVSAALMTLPEYREKISRNSQGASGLHHLSPDISRKLFAERDINVTASRIDVYNRCNFEYFCKFGLKLEPIKPLEVDPANRGTVMHFLFESVLEYFGDGFSEADTAEISALVEKLLDEYSETNLGGDFGKSAKFSADYRRLGGAALEILLNMREEFRLSKFRPVRFEYDLSKENGESVLSVPLGRGLRLNIRGIVDRVDTYTAPDGKRYLRVIDYKTGSKKFCFEDIYNGLNLQLLLYILALTEGTDADFKDCVPAGILYMHAGFPECRENFDPLGEGSKNRLKRIAEQLRRDGLIVDIGDSVLAMDESVSGDYVPVTLKKDGSYSSRSEVISEKSFRLLEDFAKRSAIRFADGLLSGKIEAAPIGDDPEHLRCAYCDYYSVCDRRKYMMRIIDRADGDKLRLEIAGGDSDV